MTSIFKSLRILADPTRARIFLLLEKEELSVAELQEILGIGQSTLSTHLGQLKQAALVEARRTGKNIFYRLKLSAGPGQRLHENLMSVLRLAAAQIPEAESDKVALRLIRLKRRDRVRAYFDEMAGKFGRNYVPGRSWRGLAEMLLTLLPPMTIADLGAGEGTVAQLLARRAKEVIAVDSSERMVECGAKLARKRGVRNLRYRKGDLEDLPIKDGQVDVAFFSQSLHHTGHPEQAIAEAYRILKPRGRIIILDLMRHNFQKARELYADTWLGFTEIELRRLLRKSGFTDIRTAIVHREPRAPHFETVLATGGK